MSGLFVFQCRSTLGFECQLSDVKNGFLSHLTETALLEVLITVVMFLKATKGKSQNRISLKQQQYLKNDKSESFLDFYLVYKYVYLKVMR